MRGTVWALWRSSGTSSTPPVRATDTTVCAGFLTSTSAGPRLRADALLHYLSGHSDSAKSLLIVCYLSWA